MSTSENNEVIFSLNERGMISPKGAHPTGFYVRGHMQGDQFVAESEVLGDGELGSTGQPGWLELSNGKFFPMHTAMSPHSPYVRGYMTSHGFVPSTRELR